MFGATFGSGAGFGGPGFGFGPGPGFGFSESSFGKPGLGSGPGFGRPMFGAAAMLLDGPATAAELVQRASDVTDGALTPPLGMVEMALNLSAGRGVITLTDGTAELTELGRNLLSMHGITSETLPVRLRQAATFVDLFRLRADLFEVGGMARSIMWTGTPQQKETLSEAHAKLRDALGEIKRSLHGSLAAG